MLFRIFGKQSTGRRRRRRERKLNKEKFKRIIKIVGKQTQTRQWHTIGIAKTQEEAKSKAYEMLKSDRITEAQIIEKGKIIERIKISA